MLSILTREVSFRKLTRIGIRGLLLLTVFFAISAMILWNAYSLFAGDDSGIRFARKNGWEIQFDWEDESRSTFLQRIFPCEIDRRVAKVEFQWDTNTSGGMGAQDRLGPFENFVSLKSLNYSGASASEYLFEIPGASFDFSRIAKLNQLEEIRINDWHSRNFSELGFLPNLRILHLEQSVDQKTFNRLCRSTKLKDLRLKTEAAQLDGLGNLKELESLWLLSKRPVKDLDFITKLKKLRRLLILGDVQNCDAMEFHQGIEHVGLMLKPGIEFPNFPPQLKSVYLYGLQCPNLSFLSKCNDLKNLVLPNATVTDYTALGKMRHLRMLVLERSNFVQIELIKDLEELEFLDLFTTGPVSLDGVGQLKKLRHLRVGRVSLTDQSEIGELKELRSLEVPLPFQIKVDVLLKLPKLTWIPSKDKRVVKHLSMNQKKNFGERWRNVYACRIPYHWIFGPVFHHTDPED